MQAQLYSIQGLPTGQVSIMARPRGGDWHLDEVKALREAGVDILVSLLTAEEVSELDLTEEAAFCHNQEIAYLSFPILDRSVPPFSIDAFISIEQLRAPLSEDKPAVLFVSMFYSQEDFSLEDHSQSVCDKIFHPDVLEPRRYHAH